MSSASKRAATARGRTKNDTPPDRETKQRILDAAIALFRERGYEGTSLNALAKEVGITAAGLYWHYENKSEILFAALEDAMLDLRRKTTDAGSHEDHRERLAGFTRAHLLFQLEQADISVLYAYGPTQLSRSLTPPLRRRLRKLERSHLSALEQILEEGHSAGRFHIHSVPATAFAIIGMCEYVIHWFKPDGELTADALADMYATFALRIVNAEK